MDTRCFLFMIIQCSLLLLCFASSLPTLSHENERSALLEFKESFFNKTKFYPYNACKKVESWKLEAGFGNCCAWDGIECDKNSGHVIGVQLPYSCLSGSFNSNTSLFHLAHLQTLNLSDNELHGPVPPEILKLTNLLSLDLSYNFALELRKPNIFDLVKHMSKLENLILTFTNMSTPIPAILANSSSIRVLMLDFCNLQGEFPPAIFEWPKLEILDISVNTQLSGHLPEFCWRSSLKSLSLSETNFSGQLPSSIGNLTSLNKLHLGINNFVGEIPSSIGNLTQLTGLSMIGNQLKGEISSWIGQLSYLEWLDLRSNKITGEIPNSFVNLTQLTHLDLYSNQFSGQIGPQLTKLTRLSFVDLSFNNFSGSIPSSIAKLKSLTVLDLGSNNLNGTMKISLFSGLTNLRALSLSFNKLSLVDDPNNTNAKLIELLYLGLASCNLISFPTFLQHQERLTLLDLSNNNIHGEIPDWFLNTGTESLETLNLSSNSLTRSLYRPLTFKWKFLSTLDLRHNNLEGSVPIPPRHIRFYLVSNNKLFGNIPSEICELGEIQGLDLSNNNLNGALPHCMSNLSDTLSFLSLHDNNFIGGISLVHRNGDCSLTMVDLSNNRFQGLLPRSLASCYDLEFLNLGNNQFKDVFPSWLGSLRHLRVLILHSNEFYGAIGEPYTNEDFYSLQIVDLSSNNFENCLPSSYFECWQVMKIESLDQESYMGENLIRNSTILDPVVYHYTITIIVKGLKMSYPKIQNFLTFIDLSNNNFSCEISRTIQTLVAVQYLNVSKNNLTGPIPSFLKSLTQLEALDLSQNNLYGTIPQELTKLTFLGTFNVSYNNLSGRIPEGRQFGTFSDDSYFGNSELCGPPLSKKCGDIQVLTQPQSKYRDEQSIEFDWKVVLMGYGSGFIIGVVIGQGFTIKPPIWILKFFGKRAHMRRS